MFAEQSKVTRPARTAGSEYVGVVVILALIVGAVALT